MTDHLLIRAMRGESVERVPVWAMRQAGRWDPEFNRVRAGKSFYEFSEDVEASIRASLLPKRFGVDAIILFYDITTLPMAMGLPFTLRPGQGPVPDRPVRNLDDVRELSERPDPTTYQHVRDLLAGVKAELRGELPVLVFAGAPFTVATYCIGTGKNLDATRRFAAEQPLAWGELLEGLTAATVDFLTELTGDGADAYQLFDSWAGGLTESEYDAWALPGQRRIFAEVNDTPSVLFVKECPHFDRLTASGAGVISLGTRHDLAAARSSFPHLTFQGNVSDELLRTGTAAEVVAATKQCLMAGGGHRHVLNLSHGCDRDTPVANFEAFVTTARSFRPEQMT